MSVMSELHSIESALKQSSNEWEWHVATLIAEIPEGYIITYGTLAEWANYRFSFNLVPRNTANLRRKLYKLLDDLNPALPLHRISKKGDTSALSDKYSRPFVEKRRREEGSWVFPKWFDPHA